MSWNLTLDGHTAFLSTRSRPGGLVASSIAPSELAKYLSDLGEHRVLIADIPRPDELRDITYKLISEAIGAHSMPVIISISESCDIRCLSLALRADIRIATEAVIVSIAPIDKVLEADLVSLLSRVVGSSVAGYWTLAGSSIDASEALRCGLFHEVVASERLEERVTELAVQVSRGAPLALRYGKEAILRGRDLPLRAALDLEADLYSLLQHSADRTEGVSAYLEHRIPNFKGK